jgi:hypothetical protein
MQTISSKHRVAPRMAGFAGTARVSRENCSRPEWTCPQLGSWIGIQSRQARNFELGRSKSKNGCDTIDNERLGETSRNTSKWKALFRDCLCGHYWRIINCLHSHFARLCSDSRAVQERWWSFRDRFNLEIELEALHQSQNLFWWDPNCPFTEAYWASYFGWICWRIRRVCHG